MTGSQTHQVGPPPSHTSNVAMHWPLERSHTRMVLSALLLATCFPLGLTTTPCTFPVCP